MSFSIKGEYTLDLHEILHTVDFGTLIRLEKLRTGHYSSVKIKREDGWEIALTTKTAEGEKLQNEIFIRKSNYAYGVVELYRTFHCALDVYIQSLSYQSINYRWDKWVFGKDKKGAYLLLGGIKEIRPKKEHYLYLISALRNRTYLHLDGFLITPLKATYEGFLIDRVGLYLLLEKSLIL